MGSPQVRFWGQAEVDRQAKPAGSVENVEALVPTSLRYQRASGAAWWLFSMHASAKSLGGDKH